MAPTPPVERLLSLAMLLLSRREALTADELFDTLPTAYTGAEDARRRKLGRDLEELRALGLSVNYYDDEAELGYRVETSTAFLSELRLPADEAAALLAVCAAAIEAGHPLRTELSHALLKVRTRLRTTHTGTAAHLYVATREESPHAPLLIDAVAARRPVQLRYGSDPTERRVDPYAAIRRRGRLYLVGFCHRRRALRTFLADRIHTCTTVDDRGGRFEIPAGFDAAQHLPRWPWQLHRHAPVDVTLEFTPDREATLRKQLGWEQPSQAVTNLDGLCAQLLACGPGVRLAGPESARARLSELIGALQRSHAS